MRQRRADCAHRAHAMSLESKPRRGLAAAPLAHPRARVGGPVTTPLSAADLPRRTATMNHGSPVESSDSSSARPSEAVRPRVRAQSLAPALTSVRLALRRPGFAFGLRIAPRVLADESELRRRACSASPRPAQPGTRADVILPTIIEPTVAGRKRRGGRSSRRRRGIEAPLASREADSSAGGRRS